MLSLWPFSMFLLLCLSLIRYFSVYLWAAMAVITSVVEICLVLKLRKNFKMLMVCVIERWDFFITSSSTRGIINMFHPEWISRALLSRQSSILESSFLFGWGSVSSTAKRCSSILLPLLCQDTKMTDWDCKSIKPSKKLGHGEKVLQPARGGRVECD